MTDNSTTTTTTTVTDKKLIAVMGATGAQGGAVIQAFHTLATKNDSNSSSIYEIRAISRNPNSKKAKALVEGLLVKEVVKADADDEDSLVAAFQGCYGAFVVTDFWQDCNVQHEIETTRTIQNAAKRARLQHVVLSTLDDTRTLIEKADNKDTWKVLPPTELGMYVPHFDGKGQAAEEFAKHVPTTKLLTTFYLENFINLGMGPRKQKNNKESSDASSYAITFPMGNSKLSMVSTLDIGKVACACFQNPEMTIGKTVGVQSDALTCEEIAQCFSQALGVPVVYNDVSEEVYAEFLGFPGAEDLANMFRFYKEFEVYFVNSRTKALSEDASLMNKVKELGGLYTFQSWLDANVDAFQV